MSAYGIAYSPRSKGAPAMLAEITKTGIRSAEHAAALVLKLARRGDVVRYDARANGTAEGRITRVVNVKTATGSIRYLDIVGAGLLVPASDVIEVVE